MASTAKATLGTTGKTQDDAGILNSEIVKFANVRVPLALSVGLIPVLASSLLYVSTFSITSQFLVGGAAGLIAMFSFQLFQVHRSSVRRHKGLQVAQLSELSTSDVKRLVPPPGNFPEWAVSTEFDKVEWLNKQMNIIWPFLDKAISAMAKETVQPILDQYAMGLINKFILQDMTLGVRSPRFDGMKVSAGEEDETVLEAQFAWTPEKENLVLKIESTGPDFKVKVNDIHVNGTMKIILKPLLEVVPCFGAVLVAFTEAPDIDFTLKFLGLSNDALPGVDKFIDSRTGETAIDMEEVKSSGMRAVLDSIRTALMDSMVWPCRIVVPVAEGDWSYLELHPIAELDLTFIEATDIMQMDVIGKSDPFCMFYIRQKADKIKRSSTKKNKKTATWNESFILEVEDKDVQVLTIRLMDDESVEKSQYIGSAELKLSDMKPNVPVDLWVDMVENPHSAGKDSSRGRVHLHYIYKPLPDSDPRTAAAAKEKNKKTPGKSIDEVAPNTA